MYPKNRIHRPFTELIKEQTVPRAIVSREILRMSDFQRQKEEVLIWREHGHVKARDKFSLVNTWTSLDRPRLQERKILPGKGELAGKMESRKVRSPRPASHSSVS